MCGPTGADEEKATRLAGNRHGHCGFPDPPLAQAVDAKAIVEAPDSHTPACTPIRLQALTQAEAEAREADAQPEHADVLQCVPLTPACDQQNAQDKRKDATGQVDVPVLE